MFVVRRNMVLMNIYYKIECTFMNIVRMYSVGVIFRKTGNIYSPEKHFYRDVQKTKQRNRRKTVREGVLHKLLFTKSLKNWAQIQYVRKIRTQ